MISELNIQNFKIHRNTRLSIGGLTVLAGVNSSGKSSVLQSLLLLRQSFMKGRIAEGLELNDSLCRLGKGQDVLYRLAGSNEMVFDMTDGITCRFAYNVEADLDKTFLHRIKEDGTKAPGFADFSLFGKNFQYVSSLRGGGESHYGSYDYEVGERQQISKELGRGEAVAHYLHYHRADDSFSYLDESYGDKVELFGQVEAWERKLSPGITLTVQKGSSDGYDVFYGYVKDGVKPISGLRAENIGYGISHALPVVVALVSAQPGSLILLENPEAQLHPLGQSELAALICRAVQNGVQVVLETHSDHILSGIQLAALRYEKGVAGGLDRRKIRLYYFDKDEATRTFARPTEVRILPDGQLDHQPIGFFDQEADVFLERQRLLRSNG